MGRPDDPTRDRGRVPSGHYRHALQGGTQDQSAGVSTRWIDGIAQVFHRDAGGRHWTLFRLVLAGGFAARALVHRAGAIGRDGADTARSRSSDMMTYARHAWRQKRPADRSLRIALIGSRGIPASYSGFETFYEQLAVRLVARGHLVTVYNRSHHYTTRAREYRGVRIVTLPSIRSKHLDTLSHSLLSLLHAIFSGHDIFYLVIVGNSPLCILARLFGKKVILNVDGEDFAREKWRGFAKTYLRWSERLASRWAE